MKITFYGVRGSIAISGEEYFEHGGCTTCLGMQLSEEDYLIFDAGTGIKRLGDEISKKPNIKNIHLLMTHHHLDHIQGFPFFQPIYNPEININIYSPAIDGYDENEQPPVLAQMREPYFPVPASALPANIQHTTLAQTMQTLNLAKHDIQTQRINHPGGGLAYRINSKDGSIVFITDNELSSSSHQHTNMDEWVEFCKGAQVLIHDSQFTCTEIKEKKDWGHSAAEDACQLAIAAGIQYFVLFHHDPARTDEEIHEICNMLETKISNTHSQLKCISAKESMSIEVIHSNVNIGTHKGI